MKIPPIYISPVSPQPQSQTAITNQLDKNYKSVMHHFKKYPFEFDYNTRLIGKFYRDNIPEITTENVNILRKLAKDTMSINVSEKYKQNNVKLANIIYSTILKKIEPRHIQSGEISATLFRQIIDESMSLLYNHPIDNQLDYRHIVGKMVYRKKMALALKSNSYILPKDFKLIDWTIDEHLKYLQATKYIAHHFDESNKSFSSTPGVVYTKDFEKLTNKNALDIYHYAILDFIEMVKDRFVTLLKSPCYTKEEIEDLLDFADIYSKDYPLNNKSARYMCHNLNTIFNLADKMFKKYVKR